MSQIELSINSWCEQCGKIATEKKKYWIDNTNVCGNCYRKLRTRRHGARAHGPVYLIPTLRTQHKVETYERMRQWDRNYKKNHMEERRIYKRAITALWPNDKHMGPHHPLVVRSEKFIAENVLAKLGFVDIMWMKDFPGYFCDILAKDSDGRECGFDVKLGIEYNHSKKKDKMIKHLGLRYFAVHVLSDLSYYYVNDLKGKQYSCARKPYLEFLSTNRTKL